MVSTLTIKHMSERGMNPEAAKVAAADAEAKNNKDRFLIRNVLSMADRDGKDMQSVIDANPNYAKLAKTVLEDPTRNPGKLTLEQLKGQMFQKREEQFGAETENKWAKTVTVDGKEFPNPFYEASEANAVTKPEPQPQPTKTPEATPSVTPEQVPGSKPEVVPGGVPEAQPEGGDNGTAEAARVKAERDRVQTEDEDRKIQKLKQDIGIAVAEDFFGDDTKDLGEGGKHTGFNRGKETVTDNGSSTSSFQRELPGGDAGKLGRAIEAANALGAETLQPLPETLKPSFLNRLKKLFGRGEPAAEAPTSTDMSEQQQMAAKMAEEGFFAKPENTPDQGLPYAPHGNVHRATMRTEMSNGRMENMPLPGRKVENAPDETQADQNTEERKAA